MKINDILNDKKVIVTVGAGGVGKTTLAAAIGTYYAIIGRRVMVVTIDPAKRLASALGISGLGGRAHRVDLSKIHPSPRGSLDALMLDTAQVFRDIINTNVEDPQLRERIFANRFFQRFTTAMAGTQEQAAVEKLYELSNSGKYDLIVLDTPPSRHAIEFLTAPQRMLRLLDDKMLHRLVKPATTGLGMLSFGSKYISKMLSYFAGAQLLAGVAEYISLMSSQLSGFRDRAFKVEALLKAEDTSYVIVCGPERHAIEGALMFNRALHDSGFNISSMIVNRVVQIPEHPITEDLIARSLKARFSNISFPPRFPHHLYLSYMYTQNIAKIHQIKISELKKQIGDLPLFRVPALREDINDMKGVFKLSRALFTTPDCQC